MEDSYRQQAKTTNGRQLSKTATDNKLRQLMGDN
jgi:hypothetical protein